MNIINPKITIITATLNSGSSLIRTISSINEQDYSNLEYIIVVVVAMRMM